MRSLLALSTFAFVLSSSLAAYAQPLEPLPPGDPAPTEPAPSDPLPSEPPPPRVIPPSDVEPDAPAAPRPIPPEVPPEPEPPMSEGRMLVSAYNSGFQWGIAPGVVFSRGEASFALGLRFGYGIDLGTVIVVPGVRLAAYFTDPNVYTGMPTVKLVLPIDRFAPFVEGGAGVGHVADPAKTGAAVLGGGGFMIHFRPVAFGAEASYQTITGTKFRGFGVGPILAFGF